MWLESRIRICFLLVLLVLTGTVSAGYAEPVGDLVSLGKSYQLDPEPNYRRYTAEEVQSSLTDGRRVSGRMWSAAGSLTWRGTGRISIVLDLRTTVSAGKIELHSGSGSSGGVKLPAHIYAYGSQEGGRFAYLGDLVAGDGGAEASIYADKSFTLEARGVRLRYLRLEVVASPPFFTLDEIGVYSGSPAVPAPVFSIPEAGIGADVEQRLSADTGRMYEARDNAELSKAGVPIGESSRKRRSRLLHVAYPQRSFVVEVVSPWDDISPLQMPENISDQEDSESVLPIGMCDYKAFVITNTSEDVLRLNLDSNRQQVGVADVDVLESQEVRDAGGVGQYDPLAPLGNQVSVGAGESKFVMLKLCARTEGSAVFRLIVRRGGERFDFKLAIKGVKLDWRGAQISATTWSYLNAVGIRGLERAAVSDLVSHHENVIVIPVNSLGAYPPGSFKGMDDYLGLFDDALKRGVLKRVVLFVNLKGASILASDSKKASFKEWYLGALDVLAKHGWRADSVYIYPYDEPSGLVIKEAAATYDWMRAELPGVKLFATIENAPAVSLFCALDITVVLPKIDASSARCKPEAWLYDIQGPSKNNSIYAYYRLMPWRAVSKAMEGVGFWSYSDFGGGDFWNDKAGRGRYSYSPIYKDSEASIRSSRRWEAWRAGLEDAALLRMLAKKNQRYSAANMAKQVIAERLGSSSDADGTRAIVIRELLK